MHDAHHALGSTVLKELEQKCVYIQRGLPGMHSMDAQPDHTYADHV